LAPNPPPLELETETFDKALDVALAKNDQLTKAAQLGEARPTSKAAFPDPRKPTKTPFRFADAKAKRRRADKTRSAQRRRR
jgi:hypothetical protein